MKSGFTLIELIVTFGIIAVLLALVAPNFLSLQTRTTLHQTSVELISDIRGQQLNAMTNSQTAFGVYFDPDQYILFTGSVYNVSAPGNFTVPLGPTVNFSAVNIPGSSLVFLPGSGEVSGFNGSANTFALSDSQDGASFTFTLNKIGVITSVQ